MKINVNIVPTETTENEAIVNGLNYTNGEIQTTVNTISIDNMCLNFVGKVTTVLRALAAKKRFYYSYQISVLKSADLSDSNISMHVIKNREGSIEIFDTLRRIGIVIGELKIGLSYDRKKLYLSNKIIKDLSRFSSDMQQEIVKYLTSVCYLFEGITTHQPNLVSEFGSSLLTTDICDWDKYIFSFKDVTQITVDEIPTSDLKAIRYYINTYSTPGVVAGVYPENEYAIVVNDKNESTLVLSRKLELKTFWVITKDAVYTNTPLSYMDMEYDMFATGFAQALNSTLDVCYLPKFDKLFTAKEYTMSADTEGNSKYDNLIAFYKSEESISKTKLSQIIPNIKAGAGFVDVEITKEQYKYDNYAQQLYTQVQAHYENFDLKRLNNVIKGFSNGDIYAMMFVGESGTGKSTAARVIPYRCGFPYVSVNFCVNIEESDLIGTMIPNPEKNKPEDPEFIWQDGILTKAVRYGYTAVLEEINFARPGVLGKLNSLLDENRQIDLPNGEVLKAHKNFRMIATCNVAYEGTNRFNKALINRFEIVHEFKELDKIETFKVIKTRLNNVDDVKLTKVYSIYELLKKYANEQSLDVVVSIRQLLNVLRQGKYYVNAYDAITDILINGAFIELPEYKDKFMEVFTQMSNDYLFKL